MKKEICLCGSGGQGIVLASIILAAAAMKDGKYVVQTQSYGPQLRGGASKSEIIISSEEIDYPKVLSADIMLTMTQEACDKYVGPLLREKGILILDSTYVTELPDKDVQIYSVPITKIAAEEVGKSIVANMVALGTILGVADIVTYESLKSALIERTPRGTKEINTTAMNVGLENSRMITKETKKSSTNFGG